MTYIITFLLLSNLFYLFSVPRKLKKLETRLVEIHSRKVNQIHNRINEVKGEIENHFHTDIDEISDLARRDTDKVNIKTDALKRVLNELAEKSGYEVTVEDTSGVGRFVGTIPEFKDTIMNRLGLNAPIDLNDLGTFKKLAKLTLQKKVAKKKLKVK